MKESFGLRDSDELKNYEPSKKVNIILCKQFLRFNTTTVTIKILDKIIFEFLLSSIFLNTSVY